MNLLLVVLQFVALASLADAWRSPMTGRLGRVIMERYASEGAVPPSPAPKTGIKAQLAADMKQSMINKEKTRLAAIRAIQSAVKQKEVDERVEVNDEMIVAIMSKLVKQRKESIKSFLDGGRPDLVANEQEECDYILSYMPKQLSEEDIVKYVEDIVGRLGATTVKDMGKVMAEARPALQGKADMGLVGEIIKKRLGGK